MTNSKDAETSELPDGWTIAKLSDLAAINPRLNRSILDDTLPVTFVPMPAVDVGFGGVQRPETRQYGSVKKGYTSFITGDVIFAKITPCMENGKGGVVRGKPDEPFFGSTEFHVLRPRREVKAEWIAYYLSQEQFRRSARLKMKGSAGQLRVPTSFLEATALPLPPANEQIRILDAIEELFTDLDAGVAALQRVQKKLTRYRAALLHAAVTGRLTAEREPPWAKQSEWRKLGELIGEIKQGWSPKCEHIPAEDEDEWAVMTTTAIQPMEFRCGENKRLPTTLEPRPQLAVEPGDILITRAGPRKRCGITCVVRKTRSRLMLCDKAYRFKADEQHVTADYLELALNARPITDAIERAKTGSSDSGLNLTHKRFQAIQIPVPSLDEQREIIEKSDEKHSQITVMQAEVERGLRRADRLRQAILKAAFEGKLVPQNPDDEPASELLARIQAEAEAEIAAAPKRKPRKRKTTKKKSSKKETT